MAGERETVARYRRIMERREAKATLEDIATTEGVSTERVRQIIARGDPANPRPPKPLPEQEAREAGQRLHRFVLTKMAARDILTVAELARRADVGRDTLQAWWRGRPPQPRTGEKVARALGLSYSDLLNAREGRRAEPSTRLDDADVDRIADALAERLAGPVARAVARTLREGRGGKPTRS